MTGGTLQRLKYSDHAVALKKPHKNKTAHPQREPEPFGARLNYKKNSHSREDKGLGDDGSNHPFDHDVPGQLFGSHFFLKV